MNDAPVGFVVFDDKQLVIPFPVLFMIIDGLGRQGVGRRVKSWDLLVIMMLPGIFQTRSLSSGVDHLRPQVSVSNHHPAQFAVFVYDSHASQQHF